MAPRAKTEAEWWDQLLPPDSNGCRLWPKVGANGGYGRSYWRGEPLNAHQVAFLLANGWVPRGRAVVLRHTCDVPLCCEPSHLIPGTQKENAADRDRRGRANRPPSWTHPHAKLTPDDVREIRSRHVEGESYTVLGRAYDMHPQNIGRICRREGYPDVA